MLFRLSSSSVFNVSTLDVSQSLPLLTVFTAMNLAKGPIIMPLLISLPPASIPFNQCSKLLMEQYFENTNLILLPPTPHPPALNHLLDFFKKFPLPRI